MIATFACQRRYSARLAQGCLPHQSQYLLLQVRKLTMGAGRDKGHDVARSCLTHHAYLGQCRFQEAYQSLLSAG